MRRQRFEGITTSEPICDGLTEGFAVVGFVGEHGVAGLAIEQGRC